MITIDRARSIACARCAAEGVELVLPDDPRREVVVACVAAVSPWTREQVAAGVSVTLPGAGPVCDALELLPIVGHALSSVARSVGDGRTQVYLAPLDWSDPVECLATIAHELAHARQLAAAASATLGAYRWAVGYAGVPEIRGIAEGQAYGQSMAVRVALGGWSPQAAATAAREALAGYSLDDPARALAEAAIGVAERSLAAGAPLGGPCVEVLAEAGA